MRMTTKGRYALRAAIALARASDGATPIPIKTISHAENISPEFLEQIFYRLRKAGLVSSIRGPGGGVFFAKPLSSILLKDIVAASGEGLEIAACSGDASGPCERAAHCEAGVVLMELSSIINTFLSDRTLDDVVKHADGISTKGPASP